jgi:antitoxin HicB
MRYAYPARLTSLLNGVVLHFRDLPEASARGRGRTAALARAEGALEKALWARIRKSEAIPPPSPPKRGEVRVPVKPSAAAKIAFISAFRASGMSQSELARRLVLNHREVQRMLDPARKIKIDRLNTALHLLGRRIVIEIESA